MRATIFALLLASCASAPAPLVTDQPVELSGGWNDVDADLVATSLIDEFLKSDWLAHSAVTAPTLRLYPIRNRTTGYIDHRFFTQRFEAAIVRSGRMKVLAAAAGPKTSDGEDTTRDVEQEKETDFVLTGTLIAQEDEGDGQKVTAYQTTIEIIETATKRKAWIGQKRIRKLVTQ